MLREVEETAYRNRFSNVHPAEKLAFGLGMLLATLVLPPLPSGPIVLTIITAVALGLAGVPGALYVKTVAAPFLFTLTGVLSLMIRLDWQQGLYLDLSASAGLPALSLAVRSLASISCLSFIALTTPIAHVLALMPEEGAAGAVRDITLTMYSTLFIFMDSVQRMYRSQQARLGHDGWRRSLRSVGNMASTLWVSVTVRSQRLFLGLSSRGYPDGTHAAISFNPLSRMRISFITGACFLIISVYLGGHLWQRAS